MIFEERRYIVFNVSEIDKINFNEVMETNASSLRKSNNGQKTFVKWKEPKTPVFLLVLTTKQGPYTHEEMFQTLQSDEWRTEINEV